MAYYTRAPAVFGSRRDHQARYPAKGRIKCQEIVAHDDCLPEDQFELIPLTGGPHRHQRKPWCWSPIYGGEHDCFYCEETVA